MQVNKTALIVIDTQNDFCSPDGCMSGLGKDLTKIEEAMGPLMECIEKSRSKGIQVIFAKQNNTPNTESAAWRSRPIAGTGNCTTPWGRELYKVTAEEGDIVFDKNRYSAFVGTNLDLILRSREITHVAVVGFTASVCVESTIRDAYMRNYHSIMLSDCTAAYEDHEYQSAIHHVSQYFGRVMTSEEFFKEIK